jgi:hypothetical protein
MKMKLTIAVLVMLLPLMEGCREEVKSEISPKLMISLISQDISGDTSRIRFNQTKEKDEKTLAMEKAARHWDRNLYLMGGCQSLDEYADLCGAQNGW